jgi:predicted extracellular nuclease
VTGVHGLVTAKGPQGFWITNFPPAKTKSVGSDSIYVFSTNATIRAQVDVGDSITLNALVSSYRSTVDYLYLTELTYPSNIQKVSVNNTITPLTLGADGLHPPTQLYTGVDGEGVLAVPNNQTVLVASKAPLSAKKFGLDFWESLNGKLVTITSPTVVSFPNSFKNFWIRGDWPATGINERGGLTMTLDKDGNADLNPETIIIGDPLDGTKNPTAVKMGVQVSDITGIVTYAFGFYSVLPLTAPQIISTPNATAPPTTLTSVDDGCTLVFGSYNVENMNPKSAHIPKVANHIANFLKTPDIIFVQEIQDDNGATDDGTVSANLTLSALTKAIKDASGVDYDFVNIPPVNDQDGGEPGGNIRPAYLWRPERVALVNPNIGDSTTATKAVDVNGEVGLSFNPGRVEPNDAAWNVTRKPLAAQFQLVSSGAKFFAVNVHLSSKGGSSSLHGNARPPVNGVVDRRIQQTTVVSNFVKSILDKDPKASIIVSGDFNEYGQTVAVWAPFEGLMTDIDEAANVPPVERYTYVFDMNSQQLDHSLVSKSIVDAKPEVEHIHVNNWDALSTRVSDHDPSVARVKLCTAKSTN